jgi:hypothetical protein
LEKKGRGRIIHISDFVEEENGRLVIRDDDGVVVKDARCIIYPGSNGDAWWDHEQLLKQVSSAITIFEEAHPGCVGLFVFDQSSTHTSLGPDALRAFDMNKTNGGRQQIQRDTIIPDSNPCIEFRGKAQTMITEAGKAKGLKQTLEECSFDVCNLCMKCTPVCPFENNNRCCMACLLSKQDDFRFQESLLEQRIKARNHLCIFLPKFHCELNPIEMVGPFHSVISYKNNLLISNSTGDGVNTSTGIFTPIDLIKRRKLRMSPLTLVLSVLSGSFSIALGNSWTRIKRD